MLVSLIGVIENNLFVLLWCLGLKLESSKHNRTKNFLVWFQKLLGKGNN